MRVLVTGGHGFIGAPAAHALRMAGHEVFAYRHAEFDLLDRDDRSKLIDTIRPDTLLHFAWQTKHGVFWTAKDNPDWRDASSDLLNRFFDAGGNRAVLVGSCAEYDWTTGAKTLPETASCAPATLYGQCKLDLWLQCESMINEGASISWGRLFFLMGRNETPTRFVPAIIRPLLEGNPAPMSDGEGIRDFMHASDAGAAFAALAASSVTGAVNIASGTPVSLASMARKIHQIIGHGDLQVGALPTRDGEPPSLVADISRLQNEVGFSPSFSIDQALEDCIQYWRSAD